MHHFKEIENYLRHGIEQYKELNIKNDEYLSADGKKAYCTKCGKLRWELKYSNILGEWIWAKELCDCEIEEKRKIQLKEDIEHIKFYYNQEKYTDSLGRRYKDVRFSDEFYSSLPESQSKAMSRVVSYCNKIEHMANEGLGFYLYSPNRGNGKTSLMACARNEILEQGDGVLMVTQAQILHAARNDYEFFRAMKYVKFLLIDDIGSGELKQYDTPYIHELIDFRYMHKSPTCFTANFLPSDLMNRGFEEQTTDRIKDMALVITIEGQSLRGNLF